MDNAVRIRSAQLADYTGVSRLLDDLHEMHVQARPDIYKPLQPRLGEQEYADWLVMEQRYFYVAELVETKQLIGFSSAQLSVIREHPLFTDRKMLYIHELVVDSTHRGYGTGKRLMQTMLDLGRELQADHLELTVSTFNSHAQSFYEQMGLKVRSSRMEYEL
ncbi:GNAT family N-acetyltransferase [Paenibacillus silvae]|uniref:GNAT family N-acetyltransferase n=1 Tax=Paenibacillus silvae TaxID=1325358 RepID=UPI00200334A7|nr:GNAT family N-acetyltransferase [Paenibacillus silvae]MCK6077128.1 GNAT family N-acetyltransferase [Paenibacillus silvae]MCK6151326.1 GNAT family N-acetyltransferase [Paenibacillus silvae]MCK6269814.1 GNAT family N-acetyltransferase [Paenibacillus silvae]